MSEEEIKAIAEKLRYRVVLYVLLFFSIFYFILEMQGKLNDTFIFIVCTSVFILGCALYFVEQLVIAVMSNKKNDTD